VRRLRILLIDDNVDYIEMLAELMRGIGHCVATAHDGVTGLARFESFMPDLAILDLGLPELDGFALGRKIRCKAAFCRVPLIAVSAYDSPGDRRRTSEIGFAHHLAKPPDWRRLEALIDSYAKNMHRAA
jgi:CheY-like chemotaxis protein